MFFKKKVDNLTYEQKLNDALDYIRWGIEKSNDYTIIEEYNLKDIECWVSFYLSHGFEPVGSVAQLGDKYGQAVRRVKPVLNKGEGYDR